MQKNSLIAPIVFVCVAAAFVASLSWGIWMRDSIRLDEAQSIWQTSRSLPGVMTIIARDVHTPLYFVILHFWEIAFGTSVAAIRTLSLIFFVLCIPAIFRLAELAYDCKTAYAVSVFTVVSPFLNWYGSEARMYSLLLLLTIASHICFVLLWRSPTRKVWIGYSVVALLGTMTHFFFYFVIAAQVAFFLSHRRLFVEGAWRKFAWAGAPTMIATAAWFAFREMVGLGTTNPILERPSTVDLSNVFSHFFIGFQGDAVNTMYLSLWPVLVFVGFTFLARRKWAGPETVYLAIAALVPIALAFIVSFTYRPIFLSRYLLVCLPPLYLLVAHFLLSYRRALSNALVAGVATLMVVMLAIQAVNPMSPVKEDYRSAVAYLEGSAKSQDLIVASAPFITYPIEYYYRGPSRIATFPRWERYTDVVLPPPYSEESLAEAMDEWSLIYRDVYFLFGYDQGYEEDVRIHLDTNYQRVDMREFSPGLSLYAYRLRYIE
ncbi:MAG: glycosyltransferase family 39 protein [bacterium]|nr:glycosyltransferase family 39 protein [bacterium]